MEFCVGGKSDLECVEDLSRHSVNGWTCHLEGTPIDMASKMMPVMASSVTEAEFHAAVQCVQDVMFAMRFVTSVGLKVELPRFFWKLTTMALSMHATIGLLVVEPDMQRLNNISCESQRRVTFSKSSGKVVRR